MSGLRTGANGTNRWFKCPRGDFTLLPTDQPAELADGDNNETKMNTNASITCG